MSKYLQESYDESLRENALLKAKLELAEIVLDEIIERDSSHPEVGYICNMAKRAKQAIRS